MLGLVIAAAAGALLMFYLDPDRGTYRRNFTRDRIAGTARRGGDDVGRVGRRLAADAYGVSQKVRHLDSDRPPENDEVLTQKVMSELYRDRDIPKGQLNINAVGGIVYLRGEAQPDQIDEIERRVRRIDGVRGVENFLHPRGTPARP